MIGIVIVTHCQLGEALIDAAEFIAKSKLENVSFVSIDINESAQTLRKRITDGMKRVNREKGVLILTDMFGGTPSNLSYSFLEEGRVEVISGVNLPMLIKAIDSRKGVTFRELVECVEEYGKKSITVASTILKGNKRGQSKGGNQN